MVCKLIKFSTIGRNQKPEEQAPSACNNVSDAPAALAQLKMEGGDSVQRLVARQITWFRPFRLRTLNVL